jgi:DNA-binding GntR family transcriptional regulator
VDVLYDALRLRILNGELAAGTPLTEKDVATSYEVARPTAKAALERLIHDGLLRRSTNKTARVPSMTAEEITDLYYSRAFVERQVMQVLAERREVPASARSAMQEFRRAVTDYSLHTDHYLQLFVEADVTFHRALVDALGSPRLSQMYMSIMGEVHLCMAQKYNRLVHPDVSAEEHDRLLKAIGDGDGPLAVKEINAHLERSKNRLLGTWREQ